MKYKKQSILNPSKQNLVVNHEFLLLFVYVWSEQSLVKNSNLILYRFWFSTWLIFIFTSKRTGFSRFRVFDFRFSSAFLRVVCVCASVCEREQSRTDETQKTPTPQICVWVYMYRLFIAIFLLHSVVPKQKNTTLHTKTRIT